MPATEYTLVPARPSMSRGLDRLLQEVRVVLSALLQPGRVIAEVQQMRKLQERAARLESSDPLQAARLRAQAARIGLD